MSPVSYFWLRVQLLLNNIAAIDEMEYVHGPFTRWYRYKVQASMLPVNIGMLPHGSSLASDYNVL